MSESKDPPHLRVVPAACHHRSRIGTFIERFREGRMSTRRWEVVEDHVFGCEECGLAFSRHCSGLFGASESVVIPMPLQTGHRRRARRAQAAGTRASAEGPEPGFLGASRNSGTQKVRAGHRSRVGKSAPAAA